MTPKECRPKTAKYPIITITVNGRDFSPLEWALATRQRDGEPAADHAKRVAEALGLGCVVTRQEV